MDGVLVVDKPGGITSHDVVAAARRRLGERRIGHTGTLDPLATGVLPLACGRATRLVRFLIASDKDYLATIRVGIATDSDDVTGTVTAESAVRPSAAAVRDALDAMGGESLQRPPAYSAKKVGGRRAYELAREDQPVALTPVAVTLVRAEVREWQPDRVIVALTCSSGYYVRALARDLGARLGTVACLEALRRTRSGQFGLDQAVTLEALQAADADPAAGLVPLERLLPSLPAAQLTAEGRRRVTHGQVVEPEHVAGRQPGGSGAGEAAAWVRLLDADDRLVALGTAAAGGALHPAVVLI